MMAGGDERDLGRRRRSPPAFCASRSSNRAGGWIAPWLDRMDRHFRRPGLQRYRAEDCGRANSFRRNCWISFEPVENSIARAGRLYRPAQDHVGDRLSASGRPSSRGAPDMIRDPTRAVVRRGEAPGVGRRRDGVLRVAVTPRRAPRARIRRRFVSRPPRPWQQFQGPISCAAPARLSAPD